MPSTSIIGVKLQPNTSGAYYVFPPVSPANAPIVLGVDTALLRTPTTSVSVSDPSFPLFTVATDATSHAVTLVAGAGLWQFDGTDVRATVRAQLDAFLIRVEAAEATLLVPGAAGVVRAVIANNIPATFAESLYFNYGLLRQAGPSAQTYVDLRPGMRLRLDNQVSQFIAPAGATGGGLNPPLANGYVAAGQAFFEVVEIAGPTGAPQVVLDPFLAGATVPAVDPGLGGAGGPVDLMGAGRRGRYLRLCYPKQLPSSDSVGGTSFTSSAALVWADDLGTLATRTQAYYQGAAAQPAALFFRGRVTPVPEICCLVNGARVFASVGATVRQILQRASWFPRVPGLIPANLKVLRFAPTADDKLRQGPFRGGGAATVSFDLATHYGPDAFDLPVLAGDTFTTGG